MQPGAAPPIDEAAGDALKPHGRRCRRAPPPEERRGFEPEPLPEPEPEYEPEPEPLPEDGEGGGGGFGAGGE